MITKLKVIARSRVLLLVLVALASMYLSHRHLQPRLIQVPVVASGGQMILLGDNFGEDQGKGRVFLRTENGNQELAPKRWSDNKIVAALPEDLKSGRLQVVREILFVRLATHWTPCVVQDKDLPSRPYGYEVPVQPDSPWPLYRRDRRNTGRSPLRAVYRRDAPWSFQTAKGIFSTPVIDGQGTIYVGSADHNFYAINPDGTEKWRFETGEIIDSAGALPRSGLDEPSSVLFPSGDGHLYHLGADAPMASAERLIWTFDAAAAPSPGYNNWWEGNIAIGHDGTYYAGNTNFNYYAIGPGGRLKWTYSTGSNNWSAAALGDDGTLYWGSCDTKVHAVRPDGIPKWTRRTWGFISASAALGTDGTIYIGSFDSYFYALSPEDGSVKWTFKTDDHIYASAALDVNSKGETAAVYFGSTDGIFYALSPDGELLWKYDTGAPIRSSAAVGRAPEGKGRIIYFGNGAGRIYALNASDGTFRWSFDTTPQDPKLRDRNDLNGSVALGKSGLYIGGEHGELWYVPYDYPLHADDPRSETEPVESLPADLAALHYVTPGGSTREDFPALLPPSTIITLRLVVRKDGETLDARVCNMPFFCSEDDLRIEISPGLAYRWEPSAGGKHLHILPEEILAPGTSYTLKIEGNYFTGGFHLGNLTLGGSRTGRFKEELTFGVKQSGHREMPLSVGRDEVSALECTRLAVPIPTMMASLNQIGFDYMDWILGTVDLTEPEDDGTGKFVLWAIGAKRKGNGKLVPDPGSEIRLPFNGVYRRDAFILTNKNFTMKITGIPVPFNLLEMRGRLDPDLKVRAGASLYADTEVLSIPTFGPYLVLAGLANRWYQKLVVSGTYITRPYRRKGTANRRPPGVSVSSLDYTAPSGAKGGEVSAEFAMDSGARYELSEHRAAIVLIDAENTEAVYMDYDEHLSCQADASGNLRKVTLAVPPGTELPKEMEAVVVLDVFPVHRREL